MNDDWNREECEKFLAIFEELQTESNWNFRFKPNNIWMSKEIENYLTHTQANDHRAPFLIVEIALLAWEPR